MWSKTSYAVFYTYIFGGTYLNVVYFTRHQAETQRDYLVSLITVKCAWIEER